MFAKSTQIALVSLFAVAATALGGCAASVSHEPATIQSAYVAMPKVTEAKPMARQDAPAAQPDVQRVASAAPGTNSHRRDDCGR
jgi:hypothetical protein